MSAGHRFQPKKLPESRYCFPAIFLLFFEKYFSFFVYSNGRKIQLLVNCYIFLWTLILCGDLRNIKRFEVKRVKLKELIAAKLHV